MSKLYCIRIAQRCTYNRRYPKWDWRAYREYLVWPITFPSRVDAEIHLRDCFTFKGLSGRKMAASVCECT